VGIESVEVEVGCQEFLGLIKGGFPCLAPMGVLVDEICDWGIRFQFLSFSFIKSSCNKVAQALAKEALSSTSDQVWLTDYLVFITSFVQFDSNQ
jgi:hypothetical protein